MVDVAQLVRALVCGTKGRGFESHLPPFRDSSRPCFQGRLFLLNATRLSSIVVIFVR